ncbi:hypothetical protein [Sphingopyxis alaskensis]|nr:hypothetical protein [Sphingopyxis alaskensis]MCM3419030.1 hypothetical protein [Sphingopyxis alaskensis]
MNWLGKMLDAATMGGVDGWTDIILKAAIVAVGGTAFVTGVVLLAGAVQ